jgi:hypothetical protein
MRELFFLMFGLCPNIKKNNSRIHSPLFSAAKLPLAPQKLPKYQQNITGYLTFLLRQLVLFDKFSENTEGGFDNRFQI